MYLSRIHNQRGSMLVIALFVIVVLAGLGITMTRMLSATSQTTVVNVAGVRALSAAQAGAEVLLQQTFPLNAAANSCSATINSPASFSAINGLAGCQYIATCSTEQVDLAGVTNNYYRFSSIGQCNAGGIIVSRQVSLDAMQEQP